MKRRADDQDFEEQTGMNLIDWYKFEAMCMQAYYALFTDPVVRAMTAQFRVWNEERKKRKKKNVFTNNTTTNSTKSLLPSNFSNIWRIGKKKGKTEVKRPFVTKLSQKWKKVTQLRGLWLQLQVLFLWIKYFSFFVLKKKNKAEKIEDLEKHLYFFIF